jgi:hypothetical protein
MSMLIRTGHGGVRSPLPGGPTRSLGSTLVLYGPAHGPGVGTAVRHLTIVLGPLIRYTPRFG